VFSTRVGDPATAGCLTGNDDGGPGTCGLLTAFVVPANSSRFIVSSLFSTFSTLPVDYQLNVAGAGVFTVNPL